MLRTLSALSGRAVALAALGIAAACTGEESPGDKEEWSILQSIEWSSRSEKAVDTRIEKNGDYEILGVPRIGDSRIIWILLKPTHGALYKQMPEGNYWIDQALWSSLRSSDRVSATVNEALSGHLKKSDESDSPVLGGTGQQ